MKEGNPRNRSKEQEKTINNIENPHESRQKVVQMFNGYPREKSGGISGSK